MIINELSKQLGVTNKEVIQYLKGEGFNASSHLQTATDDMIDSAMNHFGGAVKTEPATTEEKPVKETSEPTPVSTKKFQPDDMIACRSVTPWKLNAVGVDRKRVYHWEYFGDVDYVAYRDLQAMRRKNIITDPKIIIEDPDLCSQWSREIGEIYKPFLGVDYPEELFDLSDDDFEKLIKTGSPTVVEVIKVTARSMIKAENYPSLNKLDIIDRTTGTCLKEFL